MTKAEIRKQIKETLNLVKTGLPSQSRKICNTILGSSRYTSCTTLLAYMPLADEVDVLPVISDALKKGKKVFLPRVFPDTSKMEFYRYEEGTETAAGSFGIQEPEADEAKSFSRFLERMSINEYSPAAHSSNYVDIPEPSQSAEHILILVPGRAFTKSGSRIGRGKGFYDIYLAGLPQIFDIKKSGVCFSEQLLPELPTTPDDILMDNVFSSNV
jgi:5-formyltetrahydrofolate cyclo-ligase